MLISPHESLELLHRHARSQDTLIAVAAQMGQLGAGMVMAGPAEFGVKEFAVPHTIGKRLTFRAINGSEAGSHMQDKQAFSEMTLRLGYLAPRSLVVHPGEPHNTAVCRVAKLDEQSPQRFCKPYRSAASRGVFASDTPEAAVAFTSSRREPYLVQTYHPGEDWRYILHRDPEQVRQGLAPGWRMAFHKVKPQVVGTGEHAVEHLLANHPYLADDVKQKYLDSQPSRIISHVPAPGEVIRLAKHNTIFHARLPSPVEQQNLDRLMLSYMQNVEQEIGRRLAVLCVDLMIPKTDTLSRSHSLDTLRREVTFLEQQLPFGLAGYSRQFSNSRQLQRSFNRSVFAAGRALRRASKLALT